MNWHERDPGIHFTLLPEAMVSGETFDVQRQVRAEMRKMDEADVLAARSTSGVRPVKPEDIKLTSYFLCTRKSTCECKDRKQAEL